MDNVYLNVHKIIIKIMDNVNYVMIVVKNVKDKHKMIVLNVRNMDIL